MSHSKSNAAVLNNAGKAMRSAVRKVLAEKKLRGEPAIIWKNGKVVKVPAKVLMPDTRSSSQFSVER